MKNVKVKFGKVAEGAEHLHDGKPCKEGQVLELPEDVAQFVIEQKKAVAFVEEKKK